MARREINNDGKIDQRPDITDLDDDDAKKFVVEADASILADKQQLERLALNEEPIMVMVQPSSDKMASNTAPCWVNGIPFQIFMGTEEEAFDEKGAYNQTDPRWVYARDAHAPCGIPLITKRKFVENLLRSKIDTHTTDVGTTAEERPHNRVQTRTSSVHAISVLRDPNPRGGAWLAEMTRRYY